MKHIVLGAQMREALMLAYLQTQAHADQEPLTLDYVAKVSAIPDAELVERLTTISREGRGPYRIAQQALLRWRSSRSSTPPASAPSATLEVHVIISVAYELGGHETYDQLARALQQDIQRRIDAGGLLDGGTASKVTGCCVSF